MGKTNKTNKTYIANAIASAMLPPGVLIKRYVTLDDAKVFLKTHMPTSIVGHENTAGLFSTMLGETIPMNRATIALETGDEVLVGEYSGPRLPEGATSLPEGATIKWCLYRFAWPLEKSKDADEMMGMISSANFGYWDHHTGVDSEDYLNTMDKLCKKACQMIRAMFC